MVKMVYRLAILADSRRLPRMGILDFRSLGSDVYVHMKEFVRTRRSSGWPTFVPFRRFLAILGDVRREFMQCRSVILHGALAFNLRDAL
jgi:hypothetical protein